MPYTIRISIENDSKNDVHDLQASLQELQVNVMEVGRIVLNVSWSMQKLCVTRGNIKHNANNGCYVTT